MYHGTWRPLLNLAEELWERVLLPPSVPPRVLRVSGERFNFTYNTGIVGAPRRLPGARVGIIVRLPVRRLRFVLRLRHVP